MTGRPASKKQVCARNKPGDLLLDVFIARGKLAAEEEMEEREVHFIDSVGVRGVYFRVDVGRIVREDVEDVVALVLVGADDPDADRHGVGDQGVGDDTLLEAEIFRGMAGIDSVDAGLEFLAVAARVELPADVVLPEDEQLREWRYR